MALANVRGGDDVELGAGVAFESRPASISASASALDGPIDVVFSNVSCEILSSNKKKCSKAILSDINGVARAGKMTALMGATGSGKTTLLTCLANRTPTGVRVNPSTSIAYRINGTYYKFGKALKRRVGFVEQDDIVLPELTVRSSLTYLARLRLGQLSKSAQDKKVNRVISQLNLEKAADTVVGDTLNRGISGGERKRLAIASELLVSPRVLFLDEATSGLDSSTALLILKCLAKLCAQDKMTVVCSIHQPSSQCFLCFDDLCFLQNGHCIYMGSVSSSVSKFSALSSRCIPANFNPPDWFMELSVDGVIADIDASASSKDVIAAFDAGVAKLPRESVSNRYSVNLLTQIYILSSRLLVKVRKEKMEWESLFLLGGLSAISACLYTDLGSTETAIFSMRSMILWCIGTFMFFPLLLSAAVFSADASMLRKDLRNSAYRLSAYYLARAVTILPFDLFNSFVYVAAVYSSATGVHFDFVQYITILMCVWLSLIHFSAVGFLISATVPGKHTGIVTILCITFFFAYTGFFVPFEEMPAAVRWLEEVNLFLYSYQLITRAIFQTGSSFACIASQSTEWAKECADDGKISPDEVLNFYQVKDSAWVCVAVLSLSFTISHVAAYFFLRRKFRLEQRQQ